MELSGSLNPIPSVPPSPNDVYIVCYTSGTTGNPKGVVITHRNMVCQLAILRQLFETFQIQLTPEDSAISYLPMAHMFNQMLHALCFSCGTRLGYLSGPVTELASDMQV